MKPIEFICTVTDFRMLTPTVFETSFKTDKPLDFIAGQFISIIIPGAGPQGRDLRRAYSIASPPEHRPIQLCIKQVENGPGTQYLSRLIPGDSFRALAPYGDFVYAGQKDLNDPKGQEAQGVKKSCFIATGTGIAPFRSMVESQSYRSGLPKEALCLFGVRTEEELLYVPVFQNIPGLTFFTAISRPIGDWAGFKGRVTDYLRSMSDGFQWLDTDYYLCGHGGMINEVKALLAEKGVAKSSIHQEIYYK